MTNEVVKRLLVEIDGNVEKLRRELAKGTQEVTAFAGKTQQAGKVAGGAADAVATKQAGAARAIASATETIARQGKVSGEAAKQLISQASNVAFAFGPQGAIAGAIGIATLAIVSMFARTREEVERTRREAVDAMNQFAELDANAQARAYQRTFTGAAFVPALDDVFGDRSLDARGRAERLRQFGTNRLEAERARLARQLDERQRRPVRAFTEGGAQDALELQESKQRLEEVTQAYRELTALQPVYLEQLQKSSVAAAEANLWALRHKEATKGLTEAERERLQALERLAEESARLGAQVQTLALEQLATAAEQAAAKYDALISQALQFAASGVDVEANLARADALERLRDQAVAAATALAAAEAVILRVEQRQASGSRLGLAESTALSREIGATQQRLKGLRAGTEEYEKQAAVLKRLLELRAKTDPKTPGQKPTPAPEVRDFADMAREIQQAADGALQLAQNLGGADAAAIGLLRSVGQIAGNLPALRQALNPGKDAAGNAKPVSALSVISAGLPILGALSSLGSMLFGGASPEELKRRAEIRENTKALRDLTKQAGLLGAVDVEGAAALRAKSELDRFLASGGVGVLDLTRTARSAARRFGLDLDELDDVAKRHNITLNDSIDSWRQLQLALSDTITKLGEFGDDLDSQRRQADAEIDIRGVSDPAEQLMIRLGAFRGRSPALDRVLAGFDPNSAESRQAARRAAIELFEVMKAGGDRLGADEIGIGGDDLLEALRQLIAGLDAIENAGGDGAGSSSGTVTGFRSLAEATGSQLADYLRSIDQRAAQAQETRLAMLLTLQRLAGAPFPVPPLSAGFGGAATSGSGGIALHVSEIVVHVQLVFPDVTDAAGAGEAARAGVRQGVAEALYRSLAIASKASGDLRIYTGVG